MTWFPEGPGAPEGPEPGAPEGPEPEEPEEPPEEEVCMHARWMVMAYGNGASEPSHMPHLRQPE